MSGSSALAALSPRQERILSAVCRDYVLRGEPVASGELSRTHGIAWSSATIRQELVALERVGFLQRPHRSAGCMPTRAGMQYYVDGLATDEAPRADLQRVVDRSLREAGSDPAAEVRVAARVLSEVAGCTAVSFVGSARVGMIKGVDIVPLVGSRALVVFTMVPEDGTGPEATVMHPVSLTRIADPGGIVSPDDQLKFQARLRWLCRGHTLTGAHRRLLELQREREASVDAILAEALRVGLTLCVGAALDPLFLQVAGQPMLARGRMQLEALADVLELLEDVHRLADVLCQLLPAASDEDGVRASVRMGVDGLLVDAAGTRSATQGLTLVGCRLPSPASTDADDSRTGAVAILGSDRMDYANVVPLVEYAARALAARTSE